MKRANSIKPQIRRTFIRQWREYRGLSQDRLVEQMRELVTGFSKSTLSRIENGHQAYTQPVLEALAESLRCSPADLIMRDPNSEIWSIADTLEALPKEQQQTVITMIEALRKAS